MKTVLAAFLLAMAAPFAAAGIVLPPELTGIWVSDNAEMRGDSLTKGQALYIDSDGMGGIIGGDDSSIGGLGVVFTQYDARTRLVSYNVIEHGLVVARGTLEYDPVTHIMRDDSRRYLRRFDSLSPELRKLLGFVIMQR